MVARDAIRNDTRSGPQRDIQSCAPRPPKSAPNKIMGVANLNDNNCKDDDAGDPPDGNIPMEAKPKVNAIAVTGGPNNRPIRVVVPMVCARVAVPMIVAIFPQVSVASIQEPPVVGEKKDDNNAVAVVVVVAVGVVV